MRVVPLLTPVRSSSGLTSRVALCCGALAGLSLVIAAPATAQVTPRQVEQLQQQIQAMQRQYQQQIEALQQQQRQQIEALQQQLQAVQNQMRDTQAQQQQQQEQMRQVQSVSPAANLPKVTMSAANRPGICSADGENCIELTSRLHLDFGNYLEVSPQSASTGPNSLTSGVNARRARIGVLGKFLEDWQYTLIYDFGGSSDSGSAGINASGIEWAAIGYRGLKPFTFEAGYMDVPWSLDEATSSNDIMFIERATPGIVATNLVAGDFRSAAGVRANNDRYWAGVYLTGPQSGALHSGANGQQLSAIGRATYQVLQTEDYSLHLGVDLGSVLQPRANGGSSTSIAKTVTLSDRPELRVDPSTFLTTGAIPADNATIYSAELAGGYGSLYGQAEYFHYIVDQSPAGAATPRPSLNFDGGYVEGSWTVTGESRKYIPTTGAYSAIVPAHPFSLTGSGWGAFELAARYSIIDLNSNVTPGVAQTTTGGVFGGTQKNITLGLNWYPTVNLRFMFNYIHSDLDKLATNGVTPAGVKIDAVAVRAQAAF